ncbi:unnamed protein product [Prorocentrum cordatum]|uniref:Actin-related protein 10 n=1 Tax=Prorocentrum cordatum TaxID=2364126 RepID=A0ABN9RGL9_9DINO|nr:unnamed protein product [Polarella glacialis]
MPPGAAAGAAAGGHSKFQQVARSSMLGVRTTTALGTSFFLEKQAVVIDFGGLCTKVGFATESRPRHIVSTPQLRVAPPPGRGVTSGPSEEQWVEILDRLLSQIYFHYLSVNPKERRVVICDPVNQAVPTRSHFRALQAAFGAFGGLRLRPDVAALPDGLEHGDPTRFESTRLLATFAGVPVISAFSTARGGGRLIGARLRRRLLSELPAGAPSQEWLDNPWELQDLVARTCYVACDISAQGDDDEDGPRDPAAEDGQTGRLRHLGRRHGHGSSAGAVAGGGGALQGGRRGRRRGGGGTRGQCSAPGRRGGRRQRRLLELRQRA